jgi:N-acyl-D-aspartate/D-glutamate deacylase
MAPARPGPVGEPHGESGAEEQHDDRQQVILEPGVMDAHTVPSALRRAGRRYRKLTVSQLRSILGIIAVIVGRRAPRARRELHMLDYVIRNGLVVDGTGSPGIRADVGIRDGRIASIGKVDEAGTTELDADGLVVAPGIIDPHTHYDAQLFWDPTASPSNVHGVTTVIAGNCGFTLAPIKASDHDYIRRMMAKVEGMPLDALENGIDWDWTTFGEYLGRLEGKLGVNAGFLVGHCALRRWVMGSDRAAEVANDEELATMTALLAESLEAGGLGFSSSQSRTHSDGDGNPITSRHADRREMLAFCEVVRDHPGTTLEYITDGCLDSFSDKEIDLMVAMTTTARRPLNWNLLTVDSRTPDKTARQLEASSTAAAAGGRIIALTMPTLVPMNMSFRTHCALFLIPGWGDVMGLPLEQRIEKLRVPEVRARLDELAHSEGAGVVELVQLHHRGHLRTRERRPELAGRRLDRRGAAQTTLRRAPRPGHRRRPAHRSVAEGIRR